MDYQYLDGLIHGLDADMDYFFGASKKNWGDIWERIREVGGAFKETRYPTRHEKDCAWSLFQSVVERVKNAQSEEQQKWENKRQSSIIHKNKILSCIYRPNALSGGISDLIIAASRDELVDASSALKYGWTLLGSYKDEMLGRDKQECFQALSDAQSKLNQAWDHYKSAKQSAHEAQQRAWEEKQRVYEEKQRAYEEKHQAWQQRVEDNIGKLESRLDKLNDIRRSKESHISELQGNISYGNCSDNYRDRVEGWIDEEEGKLRDIDEQISQVEGWLSEARSKL